MQEFTSLPVGQRVRIVTHANDAYGHFGRVHHRGVSEVLTTVAGQPDRRTLAFCYAVDVHGIPPPEPDAKWAFWPGEIVPIDDGCRRFLAGIERWRKRRPKKVSMEVAHGAR